MRLRPLMAAALAAGLAACSMRPLRDFLPSAGSSALQTARPAASAAAISGRSVI